MHNGLLAQRPEVQRQPQVSQALIQGAREIAAILERRIANVRAEYEEQLQSITRERDELLAQKSSEGIPQIISDELEALRDDRDGHEQERAQWENERAAFLQERARYERECEALRKSQQELQEEVLRLRRTLEEELASRDATIATLQERLKSQPEPQQEALRIQHKMEKEVGWRDVLIAALQERVKFLEAPQSREVEPPQPAIPDQTGFDSVDVFQSPHHSDPAEPLDLSSSTLGTISPSQESMPMQVRTPPLQALPFDTGSTFDDLFALLLDPQVDEPAAAPSTPSKSPSLTLGGAQSPPKSPTITIPGGQSPSIARSPTMVSQSAAPSSASGGSATRLVIRVPPPPSRNGRKPIKPPISPPTEEEKRIVVHVPKLRNSSDEASPSESSSGSSSTPSSAAHSP
ncbi:hypothetical protein FKP32DRAFT_1609797 [Trametes sanguinea]|nr:hypothetical protein FKP32DRAFT_1609797 [Trametes sanguinea]